MEQAHRVGAAADAGDQRIRQTAFGLLHLLARLVADDALEIAHHHRIGMRARDRADAIERVLDIRDPVAQRLVHRVLERLGAGLHRTHFRAQHLHAEHIRLLPLDIDRAHVDDARQAEARAQRRGRNAMHAGAGLGDDARLAHAARQHDLAEHVVHLVRAGVIELLALEIDFRAAEMLRHALGEIERRRPPDIMLQIAVHLFLEGRILARLRIGLSRSRISGISVSATKRPPKMPKCPVSSGPDRNVLGCWMLMRYSRLSHSRCGLRLPRRADEGADLVRILFARRALDAGGDIDAGRPRDRQRLGDISGIETTGKHERDARIKVFQQRPVERRAEAARPRRLARRARIEQKPVGDARIGRDRRRDRIWSRPGSPSSPAIRISASAPGPAAASHCREAAACRA